MKIEIPKSEHTAELEGIQAKQEALISECQTSVDMIKRDTQTDPGELAAKLVHSRAMAEVLEARREDLTDAIKNSFQKDVDNAIEAQRQAAEKRRKELREAQESDIAFLADQEFLDANEAREKVEWDRFASKATREKKQAFNKEIYRLDKLLAKQRRLYTEAGKTDPRDIEATDRVQIRHPVTQRIRECARVDLTRFMAQGYEVFKEGDFGGPAELPEVSQ